MRRLSQVFCSGIDFSACARWWFAAVRTTICLLSLAYGCIPRSEEPVESPVVTVASSEAGTAVVIESGNDQGQADPSDQVVCEASASRCEELLAELVAKRQTCTKSGGNDCFAGFNRERRVQHVLLPEAKQRERDQDIAAERVRESVDRERREKAESERRATALATAVDTAKAQLVLSAVLCNLQSRASDLRAAMRREMQITAKGGAADLAARRSIAEEMQATEEEIASIRRSLSTRHAGPKSCPSILTVSICLSDRSRCSGDDARLADAWELEGALLRDPLACPAASP